jgi:hypothetical protein
LVAEQCVPNDMDDGGVRLTVSRGPHRLDLVVQVVQLVRDFEDGPGRMGG